MPPAAAPLPPWVAPAEGGAILVIRVIPRASRTQLAGERAGALLVRLSAPPVDGAANEALVEFVAQALDVPRRAVSITSGEHAREKRLHVAGVAAAEIVRRLGGPHPS